LWWKFGRERASGGMRKNLEPGARKREVVTGKGG
jgi:hypothetical protein